MVGGMLVSFAESKATGMGTEALTTAAASSSAGGAKGPANVDAGAQTRRCESEYFQALARQLTPSACSGALPELI